MTDHRVPPPSAPSLAEPPDWPDRVVIRHLEQADLPALEWEGSFTHFRHMYQQVYKRVIQGQALMWVVELPGHGLIGQVFVQLSSALAAGDDEAYVHSFRMRPEYRGRGLGTRLMRFVEADLVKRGYRSVTLNVTKDNPDARRLYERLGYAINGEDSGRWSYFDHNGKLVRVHEPGWRMRKRLV